MTSAATRVSISLYFFIERILAAMTILGLTCLGVGIPIFIVGRNSNDVSLSTVGAYSLLAGATLVGMRIFYWILEEIVGRGIETIARE